MVRYHDEAFKLMNGLLGLVDAGDGHYLNLLQSITARLKKNELTSVHHPFDITLIALRRISKNLSAELDALIREQFPAFYSNEYLLETTSDPVKDYPAFIQDQIAAYVADVGHLASSKVDSCVAENGHLRRRRWTLTKDEAGGTL